MLVIKRTVPKILRLFYDKTSVLVYKKSVASVCADVNNKKPTVEMNIYRRLEEFMWPEKYFRHRSNLIEDRFLRGDSVVVFWEETKVAHIAWVGCRKMIVALDETGPRCYLPLDSAGLVIYDCWTPEKMRRKGYYSNALKSIGFSWKGEGKDLWIYCLKNNFASKNAIESTGFEVVAELTRKRVLSATLKEECRVLRKDIMEGRASVQV